MSWTNRRSQSYLLCKHLGSSILDLFLYRLDHSMNTSLNCLKCCLNITAGTEIQCACRPVTSITRKVKCSCTESFLLLRKLKQRWRLSPGYVGMMPVPSELLLHDILHLHKLYYFEECWQLKQQYTDFRMTMLSCCSMLLGPMKMSSPTTAAIIPGIIGYSLDPLSSWQILKQRRSLPSFNCYPHGDGKLLVLGAGGR